MKCLAQQESTVITPCKSARRKRKIRRNNRYKITRPMVFYFKKSISNYRIGIAV